MKLYHWEEFPEWIRAIAEKLPKDKLKEDWAAEIMREVEASASRNWYKGYAAAVKIQNVGS